MSRVDDHVRSDVRASLRSFLGDHAPMAHVRRVVGGPEGLDRALWRRLCQDQQLAAMAVPEEYGGIEAPFAVQAVVLEELGRALTPVPYLSTVVLAAKALLLSGDDHACRAWLPRLVAGDVVATVTAVEDPHDWRLDRLSTSAAMDGAGWRVSGAKSWVLDGAAADVALVLAATPEGPGLFLVKTSDRSVTSEPARTLDPTRPLATLVLDGSPALPVGRPGAGRDVVLATHQHAAVALAAEQLGGAQRTLEMAVDYARGRTQFGRPIGAFQAIKHLLADQLVDNEALAAAVRYAADALDERPEEVPLLAHLCRAVGSETYVAAAASCIQVHGALGYTWEHDAHLYFKRATASRMWLGSPDHHREQVAAIMLDDEQRSGREAPWNR